MRPDPRSVRSPVRRSSGNERPERERAGARPALRVFVDRSTSRRDDLAGGNLSPAAFRGGPR
ncbi:hypothetical protein A33M_3003 [Rhodovulum sp. PH10]|nr:hypothetical protein A33M_3003 [Rhodovulum sp. PH10]